MTDKIKLSDIRKQYPMYDDVSDEDLVRGLWKKNYSDLPLQAVTDRIDFDTQREDPTKGMSTAEKLIAGYGSALPMVIKGIGQRLNLVSQADVDEAARLNKPLTGSGAGFAGSLAGNIALALPTAAIPGAASVPGAAAIGAVQGFIQPTETGESALKNAAIGAGLGAGTVALGRGLQAGYEGVKALKDPFTQAGREKIAGRVIQRFADNPNSVASASTAPTVTGASPTLAEATGDAGIARLQDALRSLDPQIDKSIGARLADNNAARVNTLRGLAGDDATRAAAAAAREAATKDLYQTATKAVYQVDDKLADLLNRPAVQQALKRAQTMAENQGRQFQFSIEQPSYFAGVGGGARQTQQQITGQGLQDLKMALDEMLTDPASGFTGKAGNTIKDLRGQIVNWMEKANPDFKAAREGYAAASKPINQQDIAKRVLERGASATTDLNGEPRLMPNALARLLQDEKGLIEQATNRSGVGNKLADVLTPQQEQLIRAVASEVDRAGAVARAGNGPGSATAQRMAAQNILRQMVGPTGLPESWAESAIANTLIGKPFNLVYGGVAEPKIQQALAEAVLNAPRAQQMLRSGVQPQKLPPNALQALLNQSVRVAPTALVTGER